MYSAQTQCRRRPSNESASLQRCFPFCSLSHAPSVHSPPIRPSTPQIPLTAVHHLPSAGSPPLRSRTVRQESRPSSGGCIGPSAAARTAGLRTDSACCRPPRRLISPVSGGHRRTSSPAAAARASGAPVTKGELGERGVGPAAVQGRRSRSPAPARPPPPPGS